jgi:type I restriction enzyme S subunit
MRVKLEDVCERGSSNLKQSDVVEMAGNYPIYGASGYIGNVDFYHQEKPYVAVVKDGAGIGRTTLHPAKSSVIGTMQYLLPKDNVLPQYLYYVVSYMHLEKYFTGATIPHIYFKDYKNEKFNLDSLDKQKEIIESLGRCEKVIESRKQELQLLDEFIKARFVEMFGDSVSNEKGWKVDTVESLCKEIYGGGTPSKAHPEYYEDGVIPWVSSKDMKTDLLTDSLIRINQLGVDNSTARMVPINSVIMVIRSGILKHTLPVAINAVPITVNQDLKVFIPGEKILARFLAVQFKMHEKDILSGVRAVTADNIEFNSLRKRKMIVPPIELQQKYVSLLEQVDKSKVKAQKALDETQKLFDSLMQQYFG